MRLPVELRRAEAEWKQMLREVQTTRIPTSLRKALHGLVIGPLDKNKGEL